MTILAQDTFAGRTNSGTWNTASDGSTWNHFNGSFQTLSVGGGEGKCHNGTPGQMLLGSGTATDQEGLVRLSMGQTGDLIGLVLRDDGTGNKSYVAAIGEFTNDIAVYKVSGGSRSYLDIVAAGFTVSNGSFYWMRFQVIGSTLKTRLWADGNTEPGTWQSTVSDSSYASGQYGIYLYSQDVVDEQFDSYQANNTQSSTLATRSTSLRTRVRTQHVLTLATRVLVRTQHTLSTMLRTRVRTQGAHTLSTRVLVRTQKALALVLRTPVRTQRTLSSQVRTLVRSPRARVTTLRVYTLNATALWVSLRLLLRVQQHRSVALRIRTGGIDRTTLVSIRILVARNPSEGIVLYPLPQPVGFRGIGVGPGIGRPSDTIHPV